MTRYLKIDSRRIRFHEYRRMANDPLTLLVLWFCKLCRIPWPLAKGIPLPDSMEYNRLAESELPKVVRLAWQPELEQLAALGFHSPQFYGLRDNLSPQFNFGVSFLHPSGEVVGRLLYLRQASAAASAVKVRTAFMSTQADGLWVTSSNGKQEFDTPPDAATEWRTDLPMEQLWQWHQKRLAGFRAHGPFRLVRTPQELSAHHEAMERRMFDYLMQRRVFVEMSAAEVDALRPAHSGGGAAFDEDAPVLVELAALQNAKRNWRQAALILLGTMVLFTLAGAWQWKIETALVLLPVLLFHEAGHYLAMRCFGYQNVQMFFIPFFGAAVSGLQLRAPAWKKAVVSLAGPLPGIAVGAGLVVLTAATGDQRFGKAALMLLILNGFNLLPFLPLDGGWLLNAVLFARNRWTESIFRAVAAVAIIGLGLAFHDRILPIVGVFMLLGLRHTHRIGEVADTLRARQLPPDLPTAQRISPDYATTILAAVRAVLPAKPPLPPKQLAQMVMSIYERLHTPAPSWGASLALLLAYGGGLLASVIFAGVLFWQKMDQKTARADKAAVPAIPYERGEVLALGNRAALGATNRSVVVGTFKSAAAARNTATNSLKQLGPEDALTQFGQTLVVTLPGAVATRADSWRGVFTVFATNIVVGLSNRAPSVTQVATAPDEATAERLQTELERWFSAGFAPPPWRREPETSERREELQLAWRTQRLVNEALARVSKHPDYRQADQEFSRSFREKDKALREAASAKFNAIVRRLDEAALAELKQSTKGPLDPEVLRLRLAQVEVSTNRAEVVRLQVELGQRTGVPMWPEDQPPTFGPEAVRAGTIKRQGKTLRCEWVTFQQVETGLPALAEYLLREGCGDIRYGLAGSVLDEGDF